jgi:hypothetical protein
MRGKRMEVGYAKFRALQLPDPLSSLVRTFCPTHSLLCYAPTFSRGTSRFPSGIQGGHSVLVFTNTEYKTKWGVI